MKTLVVYDSKFGNTKRIAEVVAMRLQAGGAVYLTDALTGAGDLQGVDLLVVGGPTQMHGMSQAMRAFLDQVPPGALREVLVATFATRMPGLELLTGSAAHGIAKQLTKKGGHLLMPPEEFIVTGTAGPLAEGEMERAVTWATRVLNEAREVIEEPLPAGSNASRR
jgi:flavodoxin